MGQAHGYNSRRTLADAPPPALSSAPLWAGLGVGGGVVCRHGYAETCTYGLAPYVSFRSGCGRRAFEGAREGRLWTLQVGKLVIFVI